MTTSKSLRDSILECGPHSPLLPPSGCGDDRLQNPLGDHSPKDGVFTSTTVNFETIKEEIRMNTEFQKRFLEARRDMFRAAALDSRNTRLGCALIEAAEKDLPRFTETEFDYYQAGARWPYGDKYRIHFYTGAAGQESVNHFKSLAAELGYVLPAIQDWLRIVNQESMRGATGQIRWV